LENAQLLRRLDDLDLTYLFKHALTQDSAYNSLLREDRKRLHRATGEALEHAFPNNLDETAALLAHHFEQAEDLPKALEYLVRAAEWAHRGTAHREEQALLARAIAIAEQTGDNALAATLHARRGKAFASITAWTEAEKELEAALALLAPDRLGERSEILIDMAIAAQWMRDLEVSKGKAEQALALAEQAGRDDLIAAANGALAMAQAIEGNLEGSLAKSASVFTHAPQNLTPSFLQGMEMSGLSLYWLGRHAGAIERNREAVRLARQAFDTVTIIRGLSNVGMALAGAGRYGEAFETFQEAREFGQTHELGAWLARTIAIEGGLHLELFDFGQAEQLAMQAQSLAYTSKFIVAIASPAIDLLFNFARTGHLHRAGPVEEQVRQILPGVSGPHVWLLAQRLKQARAELAFAQNRWQDAISRANESFEDASNIGRVKYQVAALLTRSQALAALGCSEEALAVVQTAVSLARPVGDPAMLLRALLVQLRLKGDDAGAAEARSLAQRIAAALPDEKLRDRFQAYVAELL
jgi:hypothetical protein